MTESEFCRTERLIGSEKVAMLKTKRVAVFGLGGVGGYCVEALARCGVGNLDLIDNDTVNVSNINRQIYALHSTLGKLKTDVAKSRVVDINPFCEVKIYNVFVLKDTAESFPWAEYDYIVDAVDTVSAKIAIALKAKEYDVPMVSAMGAGNKLDPTQFVVTDLFRTENCPLARVMRREMRKNGIERLKVVFSKEDAVKLPVEKDGKPTPASIAYVPSVAGLILAKTVIEDLTE